MSAKAVKILFLLLLLLVVSQAAAGRCNYNQPAFLCLGNGESDSVNEEQAHDTCAADAMLDVQSAWLVLSEQTPGGYLT